MVGIGHLTVQRYEKVVKASPQSLRANQNGWQSEKSPAGARRFVGDSLLAEVEPLRPSMGQKG